MLSWAIGFLIVALIAAFLGFSGVAAGAAARPRYSVLSRKE